MLVRGSRAKSYVTNEHCYFYEQDIERVAAMGAGHFSFSIAWTRPPTSPSSANVNGAYQNDAFPDASVRYAKVAMAHYADRVPVWYIFNEPLLYSHNAKSVNKVIKAHPRLSLPLVRGGGAQGEADASPSSSTTTSASPATLVVQRMFTQRTTSTRSREVLLKSM